MRLFQMAGGFSPQILFAPDGGAGAADYKQLKDALDEMKGKVVQVGDAVKKHGETMTAEMKNLGDATKETKQKVDEALTENNVMKGRLQEIEQALARISNGNAGGDGPKSPGYQVIESDDFKSLSTGDKKKTKFSMVFPVKNMITSVTTDTDGAAGDLIRPDRIATPIALPTRRLTVRGLLTPGRTGSNAIEYVKETGFTNMAGPQAGGAEGGAKPESTLKFDLMTTTVKTIAHWILASKQVLDDAAQLQSYIDFRLRYGLALEEERQLLRGDGNGGVLLGLIPQATQYDPAFMPDMATNIDDLRMAMLQAALAEYPATGHVINPIDWARIETYKDTEGRYLIGNPRGTLSPTLWGLPVVVTQAMLEDEFLVGAFIPAAQIFDREDSNVQVSTEDSDNFRKNLVTIRAEERLALAVYRPEALIYGHFGANS